MKSHATWCHSRSCDGDCGHASAFVNYDEINDLKAQIVEKDREIERLGADNQLAWSVANANSKAVDKLAETQAALDVAWGATKEVFECAKDCYRKDNEEFMRAPAGNPNGCWGAPSRHLQTFDWVMTTITNAFSNSAILKRQKELDAMEKCIAAARAMVTTYPDFNKSMKEQYLQAESALKELDAVRGE